MLLVAMLYEDNDRPIAHFHVRYSGMKAAITIEDGRVLVGGIPAIQKSKHFCWFYGVALQLPLASFRVHPTCATAAI